MTNSHNKNDDSVNRNDPAVNLVRQKLSAVYDEEPSAKEEIKEVKTADIPLSKHQAYMQKISSSGMSLAEVQTAWHNYYVSLPDEEKHAVWQEFYAQHDKNIRKGDIASVESAPEAPKTHEQPAIGSFTLPADGKPMVHTVGHKAESKKAKPVTVGSRTVHDLKHQLTHKASQSAQTKLKAKQHFQSMLFGVGMGLIVVIIMLFSFFNERFIAPFITPGRNVTDTPIIIDSTTAVSNESKIIIPKINIEIPVVYDEPSIEEAAIQNALERGVVHYATTPNPGEIGNAVLFGHSSNNILNNGRYKFAFVLLHRMEVGDTFFLTKNGTRFAYKIYEKKIVEPNEVGVLGATDRTATATLITCDPPGTALRRLVIIGEQISPDPTKNVASSVSPSTSQTAIIPSNAPSLWQRIREWF